MNYRLNYKRLLAILLFGIMYFIAGKLGLRLAFVNASATAVWPPTGIALALFLIFGYKIWPVIFLGAFFINLTTAGTILTSLGIAFGNTLEGLIGAYLVNKFANGSKAFDNAQNVFKFTLLAVILSTMISATIGVTSLILGGYADIAHAHAIWLTWWLGDASGAIIVTPFIILWATTPQFRWSKSQAIEAFILLCSLLFVGWVVFDNLFPAIGKAYPLEFLSMPLLIWVAFRFGRRETIAAIVLLSAIAIWGTLHGFGPFVKASQNESLLLLQSFMAVITLTAMALAVAVSERNLIHGIQQNSEKRFQALIEKSFDAVVLIDITSKILYASPSIKQVLGYTPEELVGTRGFNLVSPDDRDRTMHILAQLVRKPGGTATIQYRTIQKNKKIIWVDAIGTNLLFEPDIHAVVVNFRDITEKKIAQERMAQEKAEDEALLESIGDGILATDPEGKIILVNKAFEDLLGWKKSEISGQHTLPALQMQDEEGKNIPQSGRALNMALATKKKVTLIYYLLRKNKTKFPALITATPVVLNNKVIGAIEVFHDITKEKEIDRAKTEFVSLASHQLRTPLSTIKWYIELLLRHEKQGLSTKQRKYLQQINVSNERMIDLTNALLNVSRLELGTFTVETALVDIIQLMRHTLDELKPIIVAKNISVKELYPKDIPHLRLDAKLMTIILQNLLSNAVKYTPDKGVISIALSFGKKDGLLLKVADTGYGIPKAQQEKIFTKLFRADNARSIDQSGSGLGLYIVKLIVKNTGGTIWFDSRENKGTTFYVSFPFIGMEIPKEK